jgi:hypothetical protein
MIRNKQVVENIVLVTDEGENQSPLFLPTLQKYRQQMNADPNVCIVKTQGAIDHMERQAKAVGVNVDAWQFSGDGYSLPGIIQFLIKPSKIDLLMEIMSWELPQRKTA